MFPADEIAGALISLIIGTLLGREITRWLYRPRVDVRYKDINPLEAIDGVHWSIKVINLGRTAALDCAGVIEIDDLDRSDFIEVSEAYENELLPSYREENLDLSFPRAQTLSPSSYRRFKGMRLAWGRLGNPASITINPGLTENLDICKVQSEDKGGYIIFPTEYGWRRLRARVKRRNIEGRILICPANDFPTYISFSLSFMPDGSSQFVVEKPPRTERLRRTIFRRRHY